MSYGMMAFFPSEWWQLFAGLHLFAGLMTAHGDVGDNASFGPAIASAYIANPSGSVAQAYANSISNVYGGGCQGGSYGGATNGGFNGCGCQVALTVTTSTSYASSPMTESWSQLTTDDASQTGSPYWYATLVCNYNPAYFQWQGGDWATVIAADGGLQVGGDAGL